MLVALGALVEHRGDPGDHADRRGDVAEALGEKILHELMAGDRLAELEALAGVGDRGVVGSDRVSDGGPGDLGAGETQHCGCLAERSRVCEPVGLRHTDVVESDVRVLHDAERLLVLDAGADISGSGCRHDEALHLAIFGVFRPNDGDVADRSVTDPPLGPVDDPGVAVTRRGGAEALRYIRPREGFGEAERPQQLGGRELRQPLGALLGRAGNRDGPHDEPILHTDEGRETRVDPTELERHPSAEHRTVLELPGLLPRLPEHSELSELHDDLAREEFGVRPQAVDHRAHLGLEVDPQLGDALLLLVGEGVLESEEVGCERFEGHNQQPNLAYRADQPRWYF